MRNCRLLKGGCRTTSTSSRATRPRRPRATIRERQRMAQVNQAFDNLRKVVPRGHVTDYQRLSKIATLRLAIEYIKAMERVLCPLSQQQTFCSVANSLDCGGESAPLTGFNAFSNTINPSERGQSHCSLMLPEIESDQKSFLLFSNRPLLPTMENQLHDETNHLVGDYQCHYTSFENEVLSTQMQPNSDFGLFTSQNAYYNETMPP